MRLAALSCGLLLAASCAPVPPERTERDRMLMSAVEPCRSKYPAVQITGIDDHGLIYTRVPEANVADYDAFERCAREALKRELELRPFGTGRLAATANTATIPAQAAGSTLLLSVVVNGVPGTLLLDTGATLTILKPSFAKRAGLEVGFSSPRLLGSVVGGREVSIPFVRVRSISIGAAAVESLDVGVYDVFPAMPAVDGLLGANFLNHFRVTIDRQRLLVSLEPGAASTVAAREWPMPAWNPGDQWRWRWQSAKGGGTYARRVEGEETVDDVAYYVVKSGQRSIYFVKSNLGWHFEKADGSVRLRRTPAVAHEWPLSVGKSWKMTYRLESADGEPREIHRTCTAVGEPKITVAGGAFETLHVVCRDRAGRIVEEYWYASEVKNWVRQRLVFSDGDRVDEIMSWSLGRR